MPILTFEEYDQIKHVTPYLFTLKDPNNEQFLYYSGEKHSFNPNDKQWENIKNFWDDFLIKTRGKKRIVFVEGGYPPIKHTEEEAITQAGGTGLIAFLASKSDIQIYCPEPRRKDEIGELSNFFTREEIQYYYFARIVNQWWQKNEPRPEFKQFIKRFLERDKKVSDWQDFDFSLENMKIIHKNIYGSSFDLYDKDFFQAITTPVELTTVTNRVARACSNFRNKFIADEILKFWREENSIFSEYGASHAVMQEPYLREKIINLV